MPVKKKDDETVIPSAIQKQADAADKLQNQLKNGGQDPEPVVVDPNAEPTPAVPAVPAAEPAQPAAPAQPAPVSYVPPAIADPISADDDSYKNKYDVLKGKYDSEVPALSREIDSLKVVMNQMQQTIEAQSVAAASSTPARVETGIKALDPEAFTEYGKEIIELANGFNAILKQNEQMAAQLAQNQGVGQDPELAKRTERLEATVQQTNETRYYDELTRAVEDWRTINRLPAFDQWLREIDPISMAARLDILQYAAANLNSQQVINIFNQFKMDSGMIAPGTPTPTPATPTINPHLGNQLMPDANLSVANELEPSGAQVVYPTATEFKQASNDMVQGRITEAQYNDIANRYQMAIKAGKVMP